MPLSQGDREALLAQVDRFRRRELAPGKTIDLARVTGVAREVGLLAVEALEDRRLSLGSLELVARACPGAAFHLHTLALGRFLLRRSSLPDEEGVVPCLDGGRGLARGALARLLRRAAPEPGDAALLDGHFLVPGADALLQAGEGWRALIAPTYDRHHHEVAWRLWQRAELELTRCPASHGLDETGTWIVKARGAGTPAGGDARLLALALHLHAAGLVAIALGAVRAALERAREYAGLRVQGGGPIEGHAAVQLMLGNAAATIDAVALALEGLAARPDDGQLLAASLALRARAHPLLCDAANACLQVFGGLGYMQETGQEKAVRDCNHLRLLCGTPADLALFLAAWERAS
jgi:alkylation response protein AidB-like acyl-CoA dehydrogenase